MSGEHGFFLCGGKSLWGEYEINVNFCRGSCVDLHLSLTRDVFIEKRMLNQYLTVSKGLHGRRL